MVSLPHRKHGVASRGFFFLSPPPHFFSLCFLQPQTNHSYLCQELFYWGQDEEAGGGGRGREEGKEEANMNFNFPCANIITEQIQIPPNLLCCFICIHYFPHLFVTSQPFNWFTVSSKKIYVD